MTSPEHAARVARYQAAPRDRAVAGALLLDLENTCALGDDGGEKLTAATPDAIP